MFLIGRAIYLFLLTTILAVLDFQVEGKHGWAEKMPCWRPKNPRSFVPRVYSWIMEGRPLTGYHAAFFSLVFIFFHYPFFTGAQWNLVRELQTVSRYALVMLFEDFLWFVWNPAYGLRKFKPQFATWHPKWIGPVPNGYPKLLGFSLGFVMIGRVSTDWLFDFGIFVGLTAVSCLLSHFFIKRSPE